MDDKYKDILDLAIEIEGIALLLEKGLTASKEIAYENLVKKINALHEMTLILEMDSDETDEKETAPATAKDPEATVLPTAKEEANEEEPEKKADEKEESAPSEDDLLVSQSAEEEQREDADPFDVDEDDDDSDVDDSFMPMTDKTPAKISEEDVVDDFDEMIVLDDDFETIDSNSIETKPASDDKVDNDLFSFADSSTTSAMRLDEKLASKDISKSISINDKRRFCRELFSNSEVKFRDAIDMIHAMSSYEEAEDYFYNDLCWNVDNDEVKDFMARVQNHFRR